MNDSLTTDERQKLRTLVETWGESKLSHEMGVSVETLLRGLADRPLRHGSVVVLRIGIEKVAKLKTTSAVLKK